MYRARMWIKRNYVNAIFNLIMLIFTIVIVGIIFNNINKNELNIISKMELFTIPLAGLGVIIGVKKNYISGVRHLNIEKAKITSKFVEDFRDLMAELDMVTMIKEVYFRENSKINSLLNSIESKKVLEFDTLWFEKLIHEHDLTLDEINKYLSKDVYDEKIEDYFRICTGALLGSQMNTKTKKEHGEGFKFLIKIDEINQECEDNLRAIDSALHSASEDEKESYIEKKEKEINDRDKRIRTVMKDFNKFNRHRDSKALNDLECLCMEVKFNLISYMQIYNLIINPFEHYIKILYIDIMTSRIAGEKDNYLLFSNLVLLYEELMKIRVGVINENNKSKKKLKKKMKYLDSHDRLSL